MCCFRAKTTYEKTNSPMALVYQSLYCWRGSGFCRDHAIALFDSTLVFL
jgi:hypothetical protein